MGPPAGLAQVGIGLSPQAPVHRAGQYAGQQHGERQQPRPRTVLVHPVGQRVLYATGGSDHRVAVVRIMVGAKLTHLVYAVVADVEPTSTMSPPPIRSTQGRIRRS